MVKHYIVHGAMTAVAIIGVDVVCGARIETGEREPVFVGEPCLDDIYAGSIGAQCEVHRRPRAASRATRRRKARVPVGGLNPVRGYSYPSLRAPWWVHSHTYCPCASE